VSSTHLERTRAIETSLGELGSGELPADVEVAARLALTDRIPELGSWTWDPREELLSVSERFTALLALPAGTQMTMAMALEAMPEQDAARVRSVLDALLGGDLDSCRVDYRVRGAQGGVRSLEGYCVAIRADDRAGVRVIGVTKDVTAQVEAAAELSEASRFWQATLDSLDAHVAVLDARGEIVAVNRPWSEFSLSCGGPEVWIGVNYLAVCDAAGEPLASDVARGLRQIIAGERNFAQWEYPFHSPAEQRWFAMRATRYQAPGQNTVVVHHQDVTARHLAEAEALEAKHELEGARDYLRAVTDTMDEAMFTLDVEGFVQYINPTAELVLGWSGGELDGKLMHELTHGTRPDGSPFPIEECPIVAARAEGRVVHVVQDTFIRRDGSRLPVSYTALPFSTDAGVEGCVVIFEDITERQAEERRVESDREKLAWAGRIREALAEDLFELFSQPIVDCRDGRVVQQELLLRMRDPRRDALVLPGAFLPVAEELGLIREIDRWVIKRAVEIASEFGPVELNLSARSICDPDLIDYIEDVIGRAGVEAASLVFEITETAILGEEEAARAFIERLHQIGCAVALDDFGTGYGTFSSLKQLPIDILKIDAEFVGDVRESAVSRKVVETVVSLARAFSLRTVAEGVEDQETLELLIELGVDQAQGYHLGRPHPLLGEEESGARAATAGSETARRRGSARHARAARRRRRRHRAER
jgi:PAS domain S-box-containing protein